jgi:hypothetical protein
MRNRFFLDSKLEVLVSSFGGVGTTFLSVAISEFLQTNNPADLDGYKHAPVPPLSRNKNLKVIYVVGDPILAAASLFRRGFHFGQSGKLQYSCLLRRILPQGLTLEDYAAQGTDRFLFESHFYAWCRDLVFYPTLIVKYESIHDHIKEIATFLGLPEQFVDTFPARQDRNSHLSDIRPETLKNLLNMYGGLKREVDALPAVSESKGKKPQSEAFFDQRYAVGVCRDVFWSLFGNRQNF